MSSHRGITKHKLSLHGVFARARVREEVDFVCPRCGVDRHGAVVERQRWFHLAGLPLIPLAELEPVVECGTCGHQSGTAVLDVLTSVRLSECLAAAMRYSVASVVKAGIEDGNGVGPDVLDEVFEVMRAAGGHYDELVLAADLASVDEGRVQRVLRPLSEELTPHGKQGFLHRMVSIAVADGHLNRNEQWALIEIGVGLGMAAPHINGVLAAVAGELQSVG